MLPERTDYPDPRGPASRTWNRIGTARCGQIQLRLHRGFRIMTVDGTHEKLGSLMPACTQPKCIGTIVDGYCDVCGSPAGAVPFVPAAALAASPHAGEAGLTAIHREPGFSPKPRSGNLTTACTQPGCTGTILDGYCDVCGSPAGAVPFVQTTTLAAAAPSAAEDSGRFEERAQGKPNAAAKEYRTRVEQAQLPDEVRVAALREVDKLERTIAQSPECVDIRIWLDTILDLPWGTKTTDLIDDIQGSREVEATLQGLIKPAAADTERPDTAEAESAVADTETPDTVDVEPAVAEADSEEPGTVDLGPAVVDVDREEPDTVDLAPAVTEADTKEDDTAEVEPAAAEVEEPATAEVEPAAAEVEEPATAEVESATAEIEEPATAEVEPATAEIEEPDTAEVEPAEAEVELVELDVQKPDTATVEPAAVAVMPDIAKVEPGAVDVEKPDRAPGGPRADDTVETPAVHATPSAGPQPDPQLSEQRVVGPVQVQAPAKKRQRSGLLALAAAALVAVLIGAFFVATRDGSVTAQSVPTATATVATATVSTPTTEPSDSPTGTAQQGSPIQLARLSTSGRSFQAVPIRGTYRGGPNTLLRIQREEEGSWVDFPTPTVTDASGKFSTYVELGPGRYLLRVLDPASGITSATFVLVIEG
jgi:hypothetical protein